MKNLSILIVDDSTLVNDSLSKSLQAKGFDVTQAFTISQAKNMLQLHSFDYTLLDLELPDGVGEDILPYLQEQKNMKVIVLTSSRDKQRREKLFNFNIVVDYIIKERYFDDMELAIVQLIQKVATNHTLNMLIVEDSQIMLGYLQNLLSKRGFNVFTASSGKAALEIIGKEKIDGMIIDLEMPIMDGTMLLDLIKKDKKNLLTQIMILSGTNDLDKVARVIKKGANDFMKKPFSNEELILKIDKMMQDVKQQKVIKEQEEALFKKNKELERKYKELEIANKKIKAANKSKSNFLSVMSHEIRTPLNAIIGFVQLLKKDETDPKKQKYLETVDKSSQMLTNVINDILDISKIESGKFKLEMTSFNPKEEFHLLYMLFEQSAILKGVELVDNISPSLPQFLKSDILRIKQILSNLLSNAIKFTPSGKKISLNIEFNKEKSTLMCEVQDEGIGISKENVVNVTKAFTQADDSTSRKYGGTGLGLSIVKNLLKLFHSTLIIKSELGSGSSFSFELDVEIVKTIENQTTEIDSSNIHFENKKILVAEDNKTNQMLINILLDDMNIDVTMANDGLEVQTLYEKDSYDMVLMDINMPNMNGIDAMLEIKKLQKKINKFIPIVALTANAISGDKQKYIRLGFDDYLAKPLDNTELVTTLNKYL